MRPPPMSALSRLARASRRAALSEARAQRSKAASSASAVPVAAHDQSVEQFPSLIIGGEGGAGGIRAVGSFAEAQAMYLSPDAAAVARLAEALRATGTGVVAHYYMDAELQGVLQAAARVLGGPDDDGGGGGSSSSSTAPPRIGIADSLRMGDMAVDMCRGGTGVRNVACLGVDFMSESVGTILRSNGCGDVPVYRATRSPIGCSLAESAERAAYRAWLQRAAEDRDALHVVYINTSLETKAVSNSLVPTITCTSSNVLATLLQAAAQLRDGGSGGSDLRILYGPDTYMGRNLETLLDTLLASPDWTDARVARELHPRHDRQSLRDLRDRLDVFPAGNCVVHHMFGAAVVDAVRRNYDDAFVTAHLEVPGEMFQVAMAKSLTDDGVVGSTSDILRFISRKVEEAAAAAATTTGAAAAAARRLRFILGTEAGMVTSIVQSVQAILARSGNRGIEAEIIFPVAADAVTATDADAGADGALPLVPGVAGGEGCSTAGGCATCPFMKMNDLDALMRVLEMIEAGDAAGLRGHLPPDRLSGRRIGGRPAVELATEPILYMREFMQSQRLPEDLVRRVLRR